MLDRFLDIVLKEGVVKVLYRREFANITSRNVAARQFECRPFCIHWHIRCCQIIGDPGPMCRPVGIKGAHRRHIDQGDFLNELVHLVNEGFNMVEPLHVQGVRAVQVYGIGNSAHSHILNMRRLAAENSDHLIDFALVF